MDQPDTPESINTLLNISDSHSDELRLRYLSFISRLIGQDFPIQLHFFDFPDKLSGRLNVWCPGFVHSDSQGVLCLKNLSTPLGIASRVRVRESDVVALELDLSILT